MSNLAPSAVQYLVVHCSATPPEQNIGVVELDRMHRERGFLKIGYHYVIRRNGVIEKGRADNEIGAHVEGYNHCSLGICLVGGVAHADTVKRDNNGNLISFVAENNFTDDQFHSLALLLEKLRESFPHTTIQGHRDFPNVHKDCPSYDVKTWLADTAPNLL